MYTFLYSCIDILLEMFDDKHVHVFDNLLHVYHTKSIFTKKLVINIKLDIIEQQIFVKLLLQDLYRLLNSITLDILHYCPKL